MRTLSRLFLFLTPVLAFADAGFGPAPTYNAHNAASKGRSISVAPGSYVAITIDRVGFGNPDGLTVTLDASGFTTTLPWRKAPNASDDTIGPVIWAGLPANAPLGRATIVLRGNGTQFASMPVEIVRNAPGLFTKNYHGYGPAIAQAYIDFFGRFYQPSTVSLTENATPDHFVSLLATGLGDATASEVFVEISGYPIPVTYAGGHGEVQFHDQLPDALESTHRLLCADRHSCARRGQQLGHAFDQCRPLCLRPPARALL